MIPKIAHFHWTGSPMPWLRMVSIATFRRFNPGWEIRLHDTPADIREHKLMYGQEADWMAWRTLAEHGGFQVCSDVVFIKPVPDEWLDCDINACFDTPTSFLQIAMRGAVPGHSVMKAFSMACDNVARGAVKNRKLPYQAMGTHLTSAIGKNIGEGWGKKFMQPMVALCPYNWNEINKVWEDVLAVSLPEETIGIHWYGASQSAVENESDARPGHPSWIVRLAETLFP